MNKLGIWAIVIAAAFVVEVFSANPVVNAAGGSTDNILNS